MSDRERIDVKYDGHWAFITTPLYWKIYNLGDAVAEMTVKDLADMFLVEPASVYRIYTIYKDYLPYRPKLDTFYQTDATRAAVHSMLEDGPKSFSEIRFALKLTDSQLTLALSIMYDVAQDDASGLLFLVDTYESVKDILIERAGSVPRRLNRFVGIRN